MRITRRKFIWGTIFGICAGYCDARFLESGWLEVTHKNVALSKDGRAEHISILHLSDFHLGSEVPLRLIESAIELGLAKNPDLILLTGDYVTKELSQMSAYQAALKRLSGKAPTFACMGNHDGGAWASRNFNGPKNPDELMKLLQQCDIQVLHDTSTRIEIRKRAIRLVGISDIWAGTPNIAAAFTNSDSWNNESIVLLSHNPDSKELLVNCPWQLMLSGHTHGGQLRVPMFGATPFAPVRDHRYVSGLNRFGEKFIHTTRGVGNLFGMRFNCRPEVSLLSLI